MPKSGQPNISKRRYYKCEARDYVYAPVIIDFTHYKHSQQLPCETPSQCLDNRESAHFPVSLYWSSPSGKKVDDLDVLGFSTQYTKVQVSLTLLGVCPTRPVN